MTVPNLGVATTRDLLTELAARLHDHLPHPNPQLAQPAAEPTLDLDYSTVAGERGMHLEDSRLVAHARRELALLGEDPHLAASIVRSVKEFAAYGHSGGSAAATINLLTRLLRFEALTPLTSNPDEWADRSVESGEPMWQNRRDSRAMSNDGGKTWWYVEARYVGERCKDGGQWGVLERCSTCSGDGLIHRPDELPLTTIPTADFENQTL